MKSTGVQHHVSGVYTTMLVEFLAATMQPHDIHVLLERAGESRSLDDLSMASSWSSYDQFKRLLEERSRLDPGNLYGRTELLSAWLRGWAVSETAQAHESPGKLLASGSEQNPLVPIRRYEKEELAPNEWMLREWFVDGYAPYPEFCDFAAMQYALIPMLFDLPPGEITEEECQCRGDATCLFRFRWQQFDPETSNADRHRLRAELLETQLEQIQDMIADLALNERHEDVLRGFVGSSLRSAIGARSALLALEPRAGAPRTVYSEGLTESEAQAISDDLLSGRARPTGMVAVEVASARQRYGVLAVDEGGGVFQSHSKKILDTNARLAAAALDTVDALDEARQQANTAQVLLELATSLTEIVGTQEMASRVVQAVPDIIDCDRAAIFLEAFGQFGTTTAGLRLAGSTGYGDEEVALLSSQLFNAGPPESIVDDGIVHSTFSHIGNASSVTAPIVVAGQTVGGIVASVTSGPERLTVTPRLAARLKGLAAQASTAISNARLIDQIRFQAMHDALTGLPNRTLILDRAEQMLARARRGSVHVAVLFIDLDGFKVVNDTLGHGVGDQLLQAVAQRLSTTVRESDSIGRLGGDEFVVLVDGSTFDAEPALVAERLLDVLRAPFELQGLSSEALTLTASIGIATGAPDSATELLRDADIALYEAKAAGKNCFVAFEPEMHTAVQDRHLLEMDLRHALSEDQYLLVYQPIFNLAGGQTTGVEALLRWNHPDRGLVQPDVFIPILEHSGMIAEVGRWVLDEACRQGACWHARGYKIDVSINVSARQLETDRLVEDVSTALDTSGFAATSLTLEITETAIMRNVSAVVPRLVALKATGVRIAIDDFGTGYSSLAYLRQFPVDTLKIDRSFIASMAASSESGALIRTLVQLGKTLGLKTLAEGIEEREQYSQLERENCDSGQGFLYAPPLDADAVEPFLADRMRTHRLATRSLSGSGSVHRTV